MQSTQYKKRTLSIMLSNWYSGATLLAILLNRHPKLACNGETFPFTHSDKRRYECSCGEFLDQCDFYRTCANHMFCPNSNSWNDELFVQVPRYSHYKWINRYLLSPAQDNTPRKWIIKHIPPYKLVNDQFLDAQEKFISQTLHYLQSDLYLDGTKSIRRAQIFINSNRYNIKIIHCIRDGRAYCYSYINNNNFSKEKLTEAANRWNDYINKVELLEHKYPYIEYITIRYEDLCRNLHQTMLALFNFLGLEEHYDYSRDKEIKHILGNRIRKSFDNKIIEDKRWQTELTDKEIENVTTIMCNNLKKYSYIT